MSLYRSLLLPLAGCLWAVGVMEVSSAHGQVAIQQQAMVFGAGPFGMGDGPAAAGIDEMKALMDLRIDAMQRLAGVEEAQAAKLRLAAAAAAKDAFANPEKFGVPKGKIQLQIQGPGFTPPAAEEDKPSLSDEDSEAVEPAGDPMGGGMELTMPMPVDVVLKHEIWTKAIASILTDEQRTAVDKLRETRKVAKHQAAVLRHVDALDEQLYLSGEQREKIAAVYDQKLASVPQIPGFMQLGGNAAPMHLGAVTPEELAEILSPIQLARFKKGLADEGNPFAAFGAMAPAMQQAVGQELPGGDDAGAPVGVKLALENKQIIVKEVIADGLAEKAGVQAGDVIVGFNDQKVDDMSEINDAIVKVITSGAAPKFEVLRGQETLTLQLP